MVRVILGDAIELLVVISIRIGIMTGHIRIPRPQINLEPCAGLFKEDSNPHRARLRCSRSVCASVMRAEAQGELLPTSQSKTGQA